jgi:hypothetical protein
MMMPTTETALTKAKTMKKIGHKKTNTRLYLQRKGKEKEIGEEVEG